MYFHFFFVCSLSLGIINYACPNFRTTWAMALMLALLSISLNSQRFLQFHPTVMLVAYVNSCFNIICQNVFPVSFLAESVNILVRPRADFPSNNICTQHQTSITSSKRSYKVIWIWVYIVIQTEIYVPDVLVKITENGLTVYFKTL